MGRLPTPVLLLASCLLLAGFSAGCLEAEEAAPIVAPPPPPPVPVDETVDWTAFIGSSVCTQVNAVAVVSACGLSGPALTSPGSQAEFNPMYVHDADGRDLAGGLLTLEWTAETTATEGLRIAAWVLEDCPDECSVNRTILATAGTSPIKIPVDAMDLRKDMLIAVRVSPADLVQGTSASAGQEIHLTGTLSFVEDPDGEPEEEDEDEEDEDEEDED